MVRELTDTDHGCLHHGSEHPVVAISPGSLSHPDRTKALGVNLLTGVCAAYNSLLGSGVASHYLLGNEKNRVFFLLLLNV